MSPLEAALAEAAARLNRLGVNHALVGGLAVSTRAEPRFTRDVDVAVAAADDREAEQLVAAFLSDGYGVVAQVEHETGRLATVRLRAPRSRLIVDLLFAASGVEAEVVADAEMLEVTDGLVMPVARRAHLVALKVLSCQDNRPQDAADLVALLRDSTDNDIRRARELLDLIVARGFDRGKDLRAELDAHVRRATSDGDS